MPRKDRQKETEKNKTQTKTERQCLGVNAAGPGVLGLDGSGLVWVNLLHNGHDLGLERGHLGVSDQGGKLQQLDVFTVFERLGGGKNEKEIENEHHRNKTER